VIVESAAHLIYAIPVVGLCHLSWPNDSTRMSAVWGGDSHSSRYAGAQFIYGRTIEKWKGGVMNCRNWRTWSVSNLQVVQYQGNGANSCHHIRHIPPLAVSCPTVSIDLSAFSIR
jgi:hypothetical protein